MVILRIPILICHHRFASALTGLPVLLHEEDVRTEYPVDVDDENVTENGFLPSLPGESTRLSSAIALFQASRILNKVLADLYPSESNYEVLVLRMRSVADQLDEWSRNLPSHLQLGFVQDKPSTNVTSSRSPLLVSNNNRYQSRFPVRYNANLCSYCVVPRVLLHPFVDPSPCRLLWRRKY